MNRVERAVRRVAADLSALEVSWAVVGGFAVSAWVEPRLTRDVDVAIAVDSDAEAESIVRNLGARGWRTLELVEQDAVARLATARLDCSDPSIEGVMLDLLFASAGIEGEIARDAFRMEIMPGLSVPVASKGHLIAMKLLARDDRSRPQDSDDLRNLLSVASIGDLTAAREALGTIIERGFHRKRDLVALFDRLTCDTGR